MERMRLSDGAELAYEVLGEGPPLALVSGIGGVAAWWSPLVPALAERFTLILHDHRGTGESTPSRIEYSFEQMADDLRQLLDHLGIERCHLCGHSTGGALGQILAIERPKRIDRLVLVATWDGCDPYFKRLFDVRARMLEAGGIDDYIRIGSLVAWPADRLRDNIDALEAAEAAADRPPAEIVLSRIRALQAFDRSGELDRIQAPALVFGARDDVITPAYFSERLARGIAGAELALLPHGGHFFPLVHSARFIETVSRFLGGAG